MNRLFIFFISLGIVMSGCGFNNATKSADEFMSAKNGLDASKTVFVELNDGRIVEGKKLRTAPATYYKKDRTRFILDDKEYKKNEVLAFQDGYEYWRRGGVGGVYIMRVLHSRINFFRSTYFFDKRREDYYYMQKTDTGQVVRWTNNDELEPMIKDNPKAMAILLEYRQLPDKKKVHQYSAAEREYLQNILKIYNEN